MPRWGKGSLTMNKIASPQDLQRELGALLAYARTETPSRARLASILNDLAERVAATREASTSDLVDSIRRGDKVTILDRFGKEQTGKAVMMGPAGWVLNMGGAHGRPGIASEKNIVKVKKAKS